MKRMCRWVTCENEARWVIWTEPWTENRDPYNYTESCDEHVGLLLDDSPHMNIWPIEKD